MPGFFSLHARRLVTVLLLVHASLASAHTPLAGEEIVAYESKKFALGVGYGIVKFDTNVKVTPNDSGGSRYIDLEGNLNLPEDDQVTTIYGAYRFNEKHSLHFAYFGIERDSTLLDFSDNIGDIVAFDARIDLKDDSRFFNLAYGYNLFEDNRSDVTLIAGLKNIDFRLEAEVRGSLTVNGETQTVAEVFDADVLAPLPLIGMNFGFGFTPKWSISARIGLVGGSYQDVSATVLESSINSRFQFNDHVGLLLGVTYFDADVDIDDDDELAEVSYSYHGIFSVLHV